MHKGIDVSGWQRSVDWRLVREAGYTFAWIKASEGQTHVSRKALAWAEGAVEAGVWIGYYHYARPGRTRNDAEKEARHFAATMRDAPNGVLRPVLDLEHRNPDMDRRAMTDWAVEFMGELMSLTNDLPILYTFPSFAKRKIIPARLAMYPLWMAHHMSKRRRDKRLRGRGGPSLGESRRRRGFSAWDCWQWSSSASVPGVGSRRCDVNIAPDMAPLMRTLGPVRSSLARCHS